MFISQHQKRNYFSVYALVSGELRWFVLMEFNQTNIVVQALQASKLAYAVSLSVYKDDAREQSSDFEIIR